jgi:hypothetical protein
LESVLERLRLADAIVSMTDHLLDEQVDSLEACCCPHR